MEINIIRVYDDCVLIRPKILFYIEIVIFALI